MNTNRFYVYGHYIEGSESPFYIGKGTGKRAYVFTTRSNKWKSIVNNRKVNVKYFKTDISSFEALTLESQLIIEYEPSSNIVSTGLTKILDFESINNLLYYDETSPTFLRWKKDCGWTGKYFKAKQGDVAGCISKNTYKVHVCISNQTHYGHRIVWLLTHGSITNYQVIDHKDGNPSNNSKMNLRQVSVQVNSRNRKKNSRNNSDTAGVYLKNMKGYPYWTATWQDLHGKKHRKSFSVSKYSDSGAKELAIAARKEAIDLLNKQGAGYTDRHSGENK